MKPRRFFAEGEPLDLGERLITGRIANHLSRVLRLRVGESVVLFDGSGYEFPAEILEIGRRQIRVLVGAGEWVDRESPLTLCLGLGLCQPATMDLIIQKVVELGATEVIPVNTARSQKWMVSNKSAAKYNRWRRIAREAARQSGRNRVPVISPLVNFSQVTRQGELSGLKLIFWEEEAQGGLKQTLAATTQTDYAFALVGPEGGFSPEELAQAKAVGFQSVSLGRRVLRTETAAIVAISLLQYELGDLGLLP